MFQSDDADEESDEESESEESEDESESSEEEEESDEEEAKTVPEQRKETVEERIQVRDAEWCLLFLKRESYLELSNNWNREIRTRIYIQDREE